MHILLISEFFPDLKNPVFSGGVEARCYFTSLYLSKMNAVTVIARRRKGELGIEKKGSLTVCRLGPYISSPTASVASIFSRISFLWQAIRFSATLKPDLVEGSNYVTFLSAFVIGMYKKIPKVAWYPDVLKGKWVKEFGILSGIIGEVSESIFLRLPWNKVITISETARKRLVKAGMKKSKIEVVHCGVDTKNTKTAIKHKKKQFIVVSRLVPYKRVNWVIKAFKELEKNLAGYTLLIVGEGSEEKRLKKIVRELELEEKIKFVSRVSAAQLSQEIASSKVLIHPSIIEGFGIVLVEAAALGTPFIAADISTSKFLKNSLESGEVFKKDSFGDFLKTIKKVLTDESILQQMGKLGIRNARKFDWNDLSKKTEVVYKQSLLS
ncbi:MAG: glycosyltransferase family 4 protein [Patescibacteria group bacterium]|jgi:glycosyltransferase involved in cell wall biosynthesis